MTQNSDIDIGTFGDESPHCDALRASSGASGCVDIVTWNWEASSLWSPDRGPSPLIYAYAAATESGQSTDGEGKSCIMVNHQNSQAKSTIRDKHV